LPTTTPAATSTEDDRTNAKNSSNGIGVSQNLNGTLTAGQVTAVVQARPELIVDIKQVMADYLEQQGSPVQVDSITDDMLYRGIVADTGLRGAITVWLRARGYVAESDLTDRIEILRAPMMLQATLARLPKVFQIH
jgi:hypothetical protein